MTNDELETATKRLTEAGEAGTVRIQSASDEAVQEIQQPADTEKYPAKARILYTGTSGRRVVDDYVWDRENGYQQDVEGADIIRRLLRNGDFVIVEKQTKKKASE